VNQQIIYFLSSFTSPLPNPTRPQNNISPQPTPVYLRRGAATDYVITILLYH